MSVARLSPVIGRKSHYHGYLLHPRESMAITISFDGERIPWSKNGSSKTSPEYTFTYQVAQNDEVYLVYIYDTECMDVVKVTKYDTVITYLFTNERKSISFILKDGTSVTCNCNSEVRAKDGDRDLFFKGVLYEGGAFLPDGAIIPESCIFTTKRYHEVRSSLETAHPQLKMLDYPRNDPQIPSNCRIS